VARGGRTSHLTPKELEILRHLTQHAKLCRIAPCYRQVGTRLRPK